MKIDTMTKINITLLRIAKKNIYMDNCDDDDTFEHTLNIEKKALLFMAIKVYFFSVSFMF